MEWVQHFHENVCALSEAKGMYKTMKQNDRNFLWKRIAKKKNTGSQELIMAPKAKKSQAETAGRS